MLMNKCVFTVVAGAYDNILEPKVIANDYDYICFSNDIKAEHVGVWKIRPIPFFHKDNTRVSRYPKFHPHELLPEYEYCIYVDANILIADDYIYHKADELYYNKMIVGHVKHPFRNCVYQEAFACLFFGLDKMTSLVRTLDLFIREGLPFNAGLYENNVIYFSHHDEKLVKALDLFWSLYCNYSRRDQLSLMLSYYKLNISPSLLLPEGENARNSTHVIRQAHIKESLEKPKGRNRNFVNRLKIKMVRCFFKIRGYDLSHESIHRD